jgi:hypothetical protein
MSSISNSTYDGDARHVRFSMLSGPNGYTSAKVNGISLADELALDEEEEDNLEDSELDGGQTSPDALPEERREKLTSLIGTRGPEGQKSPWSPNRGNAGYGQRERIGALWKRRLLSTAANWWLQYSSFST